MSRRPAAIVMIATLMAAMAAWITPAAVLADSPGSQYVPFGPIRIVDSRYAQGVGAQLVPFVPATFAVAGVAGIPANAVAVTGNLTATGQSGLGWIALTATPISRPTTSTVNFPATDTRANGVFAPLGGGTLSVTASAPVHVIFDVTGYFVASGGAGYVPLTPIRALDTRYNTGLAGKFSTRVPRALPISGLLGVPAGATAITGNVTIVAAPGLGYVAITATPTATPSTSTLNFPAADIRANNFTAPIGPDGSIGVVYTGAGSADIVLDITGYFTNSPGGARYFPLTPARISDSRINQGLNGPVGYNSAQTLQVVGVGGVPAGAQAITANLTAEGGDALGYGAITPIATITPPTSTLNFPTADTRANGFVSPLSISGTIGVDYATSSGTTSFIVDVTGYFAGGSAIPVPTAPAYTGMSMYRYSAWSKQATNTWCTGASTQMMLNLVTGASDHSSAN